MSRDESTLMIEYDFGEDVKEVLGRISGNIVNGRIECTGIEMDGANTFWVKDCGDYELKMLMPYRQDGTMGYDVHRKRTMVVKVYRKDVK